MKNIGKTLPSHPQDLRQAMLHAADGCAAQLTATASPLAALFGATGTVSRDGLRDPAGGAVALWKTWGGDKLMG